ncbi:MAG: hypothetical protein J6I80_01695 [Clostridia bacterium]|nr:hypothetical protein [Clostridia bacterium]
MKKLITITLCLIFAITLCGCKSKPQTYSSYLSYYELEETSSITQSNTENSSKPQPDKNSSSSKQERSWESTVVAPYKVVFYKNGQAVESTDTSQNLKIAKHIESYFKGKDKLAVAKLSVRPYMIYDIKANQTAIELYFDKKVEFYGGVIWSGTQTLLVPLTGDRKNMLFEGDSKAVYKSGALNYYPNGLEEYLPAVLDKPEQLGPPEYVSVAVKNAFGKYVSTEKASVDSEYDANDLYVYKNDDGVEIKTDSKTKQIMSIDYNVLSAHSKTPLTEDGALSSAKTFAQRLFDLSKYDKQTVTKLNTGMLVSFEKTINDLKTHQNIKIRVNEDGSISSMVKTPDIFDGIDTSKIKITEQEVINKINQKNAQTEDVFDIELFGDIKLTVKDKRIQAVVKYEKINQQGEEISKGKVYRSFVEI